MNCQKALILFLIDNFVFVFINQSRPARNWPELFLGVSCANLPPVKYNVVKFCTTYHASNCTNGESVADKNPTLNHAHSHSRPAPFPAPLTRWTHPLPGSRATLKALP